jgi:hypothetical protein
VACYYDSKNGYAEFFDSFAVVPSIEIQKYLKTSGKLIKYNSVQLQKIDSVTCGYWCCLYILMRKAGLSQYSILYKFNQYGSDSNEKLLIKLLKQYV